MAESMTAKVAESMVRAVVEIVTYSAWNAYVNVRKYCAVTAVTPRTAVHTLRRALHWHHFWTPS